MQSLEATVYEHVGGRVAAQKVMEAAVYVNMAGEELLQGCGGSSLYMRLTARETRLEEVEYM
jgi:uncharacterized protein YvpB